MARKMTLKLKLKKKQTVIHPIIIQQPTQNYNNAQSNPEILTFKSQSIVVFGFIMFSFPALYLYFFTVKRPDWSEFQFYLIDLSVHFGASIMIPFFVYVQNSRLRSYVWLAINDILDSMRLGIPI